MKKVISVFLCFAIVFSLAACGNKIIYSETEINSLREVYPEYFDLTTDKGLEVYVWQMARDSYSFGVLPGTNREKTGEELWNLKGVSADEMKIILSTYDIDGENIIIMPFQMPVSSYIADCWIIQEGESEDSITGRQQAYIENIREMLFDRN